MDFITRQAKEKRPFHMQVSHYASHLQIQTHPETVEEYKKKGVPPRSVPSAVPEGPPRFRLSSHLRRRLTRPAAHA